MASTSGWLNVPLGFLAGTTANQTPANVSGLAAMATLGGNVACVTGTFSGNVIAQNLTVANAGCMVANAVTVGTVALSSLASLQQNGFAFQGLSPFRNRLHNGGFVVNQRAIVNGTAGVTTGTSFTPGTGGSLALATSQYSVDRWYCMSYGSAGLAVNFLQCNLTSTDAPLVSAGLTTSLRLNVTSAATSLNLFVPFVQVIEAQNVADLAWGTQSALPVVVSFWLRTNAGSGNYSVGLRNSTGSWSYVTTVSYAASSGSWVRFTVNVPGCTSGSGTWGSGSGAGIVLALLGVGTSYFGTFAAEGTWETQNAWLSANGTVSWPWTTGNYIEVAGVQLEVGTVASAFDLRPSSVELALCQRTFYAITWGLGVSTPYFLSTGGFMNNVNPEVGFCFFRFPTPMRIAPATFTWSSSGAAASNFLINNNLVSLTVTGLSLSSSTVNQAAVYVTTANTSGYNLDFMWTLCASASYSGSLTFSADF